jgi:DNA-directed RNA polymerase subunit RPC12/RpoP
MKMPRANRFVDDGKTLACFADEVLVRCIHCGAPGRISATWAPYRWTASFRCAKCGLSLSSTADDWVGPVCAFGRRPCGNCGHKWLVARQRFDGFPRSIPEHLPVECPECGHTSPVQVHAERAGSTNPAVDPHFGMPLYLVHSLRLGTVWAYNEHHLCELRLYVRATLRVRQGGGNRAMFSRIPVWMKLAKNREPVTRALQKLDVLLSELSIERRSTSRLRLLQSE